MSRRKWYDKALGAMGLQRTATVPRLRSSYYAGAQQNRLHGDWTLSQLSADQVLQYEIGTLRNRARELVISNATAARISTLFSDNVIGKDGILFQSRVRSSRGEYNERVNLAIEDAWYEWCEAKYCSVDGRRSWCETERLIAENEPVDGEVLLRLVRGFDNKFGFAVDVLDPDQLDETFNQDPGNGRAEIRMGVEVDAWGRPTFYHLWEHHPTEFRKRVRRRVPASEIIHLYVQRRPKQTRGVSWYAPVIVDLKMHGGYREAELVAAVTASAKMGFLQQTGEEPAPPMKPADSTADHIRMDADPGVIEQLPWGYTFKEWDPQHPSTAFAEFDKAILRTIATRFGLSAISVSGDLSDTSYGSGRIGLLSEQSMFATLQQRFIERVSSPVQAAWLEMAMLSGAVSLPSLDHEQYRACSWHPRPFPWIDPEADIASAESELAIGIETHSRLAAKKGLDYEELLQERARDRDLRLKYGEPEPVAKLPNGKSENDDDADTTNPAARARRMRLLAQGGR
jgi:lambda family phage portal protein